MQTEADPSGQIEKRQKIAIAVAVVVVLIVAYVIIKRRAPKVEVFSDSPLNHTIVLRSNDEFYAATRAATNLAGSPFQKVDAGQALSREDIDSVYQAARLYDAMGTFRPSEPLPEFTCAQCLAVLNFHEDAVRKFRQFLAYVGPSPTQDNLRVMGADAHSLISRSLVSLKKYQEAKDEANEALTIYPNTPAYLADRARAELQLGDAKDAKSDVDRALAGDPQNAMALSLKNQIPS